MRESASWSVTVQLLRLSAVMWRALAASIMSLRQRSSSARVCGLHHRSAKRHHLHATARRQPLDRLHTQPVLSRHEQASFGIAWPAPWLRTCSCRC